MHLDHVSDQWCSSECMQCSWCCHLSSCTNKVVLPAPVWHAAAIVESVQAATSDHANF